VSYRDADEDIQNFEGLVRRYLEDDADLARANSGNGSMDADPRHYDDVREAEKNIKAFINAYIDARIEAALKARNL